MSTYLASLVRRTQDAIVELRQAIAAGYDVDFIREYGDIVDDLIDEVASLDIALADRLSHSMDDLAVLAA